MMRRPGHRSIRAILPSWLVVVTLLCLVVLSTATTDYHHAFDPYIDTITWPVAPNPANSPQHDDYQIVSSFGPRRIQEGGVTDFARGMTIPLSTHNNQESRIVSVYEGRVHEILQQPQPSDEDGEQTTIRITIQHAFEDWVEFHQTPTKRWFTAYQFTTTTTPFHHDTNNNGQGGLAVQVGDVVSTGGLLATIGTHNHDDSPPAVLEFQLLLGSSCSLDYAQQHPTSVCNRKGYDPHVHPLLLFPPSSDTTATTSLSMTIARSIIPSVQHGIVELEEELATTTTTRYQIDVLRTKTTGNEDDKEQILQSYVMDMNTRQGIKTTMTMGRRTLPFLQPSAPAEYYSNKKTTSVVTTTRRMQLVVPHTWVGAVAAATGTHTWIRVSAWDTWGQLVGQVSV